MKDVTKKWGQLCWTCKYACDKDDCIWVRTLKKRYKGTKLDEDGYITYCPKYVHDEFCYSIQELCDKLGITKSRYNMLKRFILLQGFNMSVEEYLNSKYGSQDGVTKRGDYIKLYNQRRYYTSIWLKVGKPMPLDEFIEDYKRKKQEKREAKQRVLDERNRRREERRKLSVEDKKELAKLKAREYYQKCKDIKRN